MKTNVKKGIFYILINSAIWGAAPVVVKIGTNNINTDRFLFLRFLIVVPIFLSYLIWQSRRNTLKCTILPIKFWLKHKILSLSAILANAIVLIFLFKGLEKTDAVVASLIGAIMPIVSLALGKLFFNDNINKKEVIGTLISLLGFIIYVLDNKSNMFGSHIIGIILIFGGNFLWIVSNMLFKWATHPYVNNKKQFDCINLNYLNLSFVIALIFFMLNLIRINDLNWLLNFQFTKYILDPTVLYMSIASTIVAYYTFNEALKYLEISEVNYFIFTQPIFTILTNMVLTPNYKLTFAIISVLGIILVGFIFNLKGIGKSET